MALSLFVGVLGTSCADMLDDNVSSDKSKGITAETGLPTIVYYAAQTNYDHAEYYIYLSQCLTTTGKSATGAYGYKSGWEFLTMNRHPQWRRHFYDIGRNVNELMTNADNVGSPNYKLIARAIRLMSTQLTTDAFGDMPLSNAYKSNSPTYDTQESIYAWMLNECDQLAADFENPEYTQAPGNQNITKKIDRVYAGDLNKWKGLVYAMKARLLLRNIPNVNTSAATCDAIIAAADKAIQIWQADPMYGTFFGSEPRYNFDGGTQQQNCPWSESQPVINAWESRANLLTAAVPSKFMLADIMGVFSQDDAANAGKFVARRGYADDPRAALLFTPRTVLHRQPTMLQPSNSAGWRTISVCLTRSLQATLILTSILVLMPVRLMPTCLCSQWRSFTSSRLRLTIGRATSQRPASLRKRLPAQTSSVTSPLSRKRILK